MTLTVTARLSYEKGKGGTVYVRFADNVAKIISEGKQIGEVAGCIGGGVVVEYDERQYFIEPSHLWLAVREAVIAKAEVR